jgi:hypothetical protein
VSRSKTGALGEIVHFSGRYWCDYSADPDAPTSWRYEGPLGSGALADLGSHLLDMSEQLCGPIVRIDGAALPILIKDRPVPLGAALGNAAGGAVAAARFDLSANAEFGYVDNAPDRITNGWRRVIVGPDHPCIAAAQSMPFPGIGHGGQEFFTHQARVFLDEIDPPGACLLRRDCRTGPTASPGDIRRRAAKHAG